jgi:DNA-binding response OmpR family regulator
LRIGWGLRAEPTITCETFAPAELVARVHAMLRRVGARLENNPAYAGVSLDPVTREVLRRHTTWLTVTESTCCTCSCAIRRCSSAGKSSTRWGYDFGGDDNVLKCTSVTCV